MYTERFSEAHAPLGKYGSASFNSEQNIGWIDMAKYHRIAVVCHAILVGTSLDIDIEIATDDNGSKIHTLKSLTQLSGSDDGDLVVIEIRAEELGKPTGAPASNYSHVRVEITPSGTTAASIIVYGIEPRYAPIDSTLWSAITP